MKRNFLPIACIVFLLSCCFSCKRTTSNNQTTVIEDTFIRGADLSYLPEIEQYNTNFYDANGAKNDMLSILQQAGVNTVRIRLWVNPATASSSLTEVTAFSKKVQQKNMKVLLTIHYSDDWADPGKQITPTAWNNLPISALTDTVYNYTKRVLQAIEPQYVQIGNEVNSGMLWPLGRIQNNSNFLQLLKAGIRASREVNANAKIVMHYAGISGSEWFFNLMQTNAVDYDVMGISYYPNWHGKSIDSLVIGMKALNSLTGKPIMVAETSYPFTFGYNDNTNNVVGQANQITPAYPPTPAGQLQFMQAIRNAITNTPKGIGFCYWGAEWVAYKGSTATNGSAWENQALFDFSNKALPVLEAFKK